MNYKILETVADISYIAGEMKYFTGNSREDISSFIFWAKEFEEKHRKTDWNNYNEDYILAITNYTESKIKELIQQD